MKQVLSIVIPAHNEEKTIYELLKKVEKIKLPESTTKEIIVINDYSTDKTEKEIVKYKKEADTKKTIVKYFSNETNLGKSLTVKKGIAETTGNYVIIQDADLEYDPNDISKILQMMLDNNLDFVYGNRFGKNNIVIYKSYLLGNKVLSAFSNIFVLLQTGKVIPDMEVCYKLMKGDIAREIFRNLESRSMFGMEPEITAKLTRFRKKNGKKLAFGIVPISYYPRTIEQGKHIKVLDGIKAVWEIIKFNIF